MMKMLSQRCWKFSNNSERITYPEPPRTISRVILPPGTSSGSFTDDDEFEFLSDHDIAAGITPKSSNTVNDKKQPKKPVNSNLVFKKQSEDPAELWS